MLRVFPVLCALLLALAVRAQDASPTPGATIAPPTNASTTAEDIRLLRQLIEQQSRQIETLTQQIAALKQTLELNRGTGSAASAATPAVTQNMPPVQESNALTPAPASSAAAPGAEPPKATAAASASNPSAEGGGLTHVVAKGDTLISIAKHYKVSVADLLKMNKITDERKLQIGQTLIIPLTAKPSETTHP